MIRTFGLSHVVHAVGDPARAFEFYRRVFGMVAVYQQPDFIQARTPGTRDALVLERFTKSIGRSGGIAHFGFRPTDPLEVDAAVTAVRAAGGTGRQSPSEPTGQQMICSTGTGRPNR